MICELCVRTKNKITYDQMSERKAGDVISLVTPEKKLNKFLELHRKKRLTQDLIDTFSDIQKKVMDITEDDIKKATINWPWTDLERKQYIITKMDLSEQEVRDLSKRDGYIEKDEFVATAFRKKRLDWDSMTATMDSQKIEDNSVEYQPIKDQTLSIDLIVSRSSLESK